MSKIAIISQPNEGVLIDVSGCSNLKEALEHLSSTLQVSSQFWQGLNVSINLGRLKLESSEAAQILAIAKGVGITPSSVYTKNSDTKIALIENGVNIGEGKPMSLPEINIDIDNISEAEVEETGTAKPKSTVAKLKLRVKDALARRKNAGDSQEEEIETTSLETLQNLEKEESIRETISKRIIHLQKESEGELNSDRSDSTSMSVALTEAEEMEDGDTTLEIRDTAEVEMETEIDAEAETDTETDTKNGLDEFVEATEEIIESEEFDSDTEAESPSQPMDSDSIEEKEEEEEEEEPTDLEIEESEAEQEDIAAEEEVSLEAEDETEEVETESAVTETTNVVVRPSAGGTMYLRQTLRSGQTVSHKGHLIIIGDVNPGAEVMAEGDITIWGSLRGIAHAGIGGNVDSEIRALNLQPIQIRIAHAIARAPDKPRMNYSSSHGPETARIVAGKIRVFRSRLE